MSISKGKFTTVLSLLFIAFTAGAQTTIISLEDALKIALEENVSVKVADKEIERAGYAKKGSYASLFPEINASGSYQRTIEKQVMYMDFDMGSMGGFGSTGAGDESASGAGSSSSSSSSGGGIEVGRWNTYSAGISAGMPLINAQLWQSLKISGQDVELAVEKARSSKLETVTQVKKAYYAVLLAKQAHEVYKSVYENAVENASKTEKKYNAQKASELDLARARTSVANAIPNMYDSENAIILSLWQLKAVMGINLDEDIDVEGTLLDYSSGMDYVCDVESDSLGGNSTLRQLEIQAEELANTIKMQKYAYLPTLSLSFNYSMNAMTNDFNFSEYKWSPYSFIGLNLSIPIFSGGKRYHNVKQSQVQAAELELQRQNTERQLRISLRQNLNTMDTAVKSFDSANSALESAEKAYQIAQKSYEVGHSTLTDLNDAQLALTQAQLTLSQAVYNFISAKASIEETLGAEF